MSERAAPERIKSSIREADPPIRLDKVRRACNLSVLRPEILSNDATCCGGKESHYKPNSSGKREKEEHYATTRELPADNYLHPFLH